MFEKIQYIDQFVILLNKCDVQARLLELILKRVSRAVSHNEVITTEEKSKFGSVSKLDAAEIDLMIITLESIFQECCYYIAKPNLIFQSLKELLLKEELASMIAQTWSNSARSMVDSVRKRKALTAKASPSNHLKNIDYSITVQLGTDQENRAHRKLEPTAIFNLSGDVKQTNELEPIVFEADYNALYNLYQNLESIQEKLDELKT